MKKFFSLIFLGMFLCVCAFGCGGAEVAPPEATTVEEHDASAAEHDASGGEHAADAPAPAPAPAAAE